MALSLLLVDDSQSFLNLVETFLASDPGIKVVGRAANGREALDQCELLKPELILVDVAMPEMNGFETTRRLKANAEAPRVILMTGTQVTEYQTAARDVGADGFVLKSDFFAKVPLLIHGLFPQTIGTLPVVKQPTSDHGPEQRWLADTLVESRAQLELALNASNIGLWELDLRTNRVWYCPRCKSQLGFKDHELPNLRDAWFERLHPEDHPKVLAAMSESMGPPFKPYEPEYRLRHKDGSYRWIMAKANATLDASGRPTKLSGCHIDVTQRKASESALQITEGRYRVLFETNPFPIWVFDPQTLRFLEVNDAAVKTYGYSRDEFLAMTVLDIRSEAEKERLLETLSQIADSPAESPGVWTHRRKDGAFLKVKIATSSIELNGKQARLVIAHDVTEHIQLEKQFLKAQKMEAFGQLAGGVAHDFNNLLTIITGYSELILRHVPEHDPVRSLVWEIQKAGDRAAKLTRQLLAFSKRTVLAPVVLDLNAVVADLEKMLRPLIGADIQLITLKGRQVGSVFADPSQIEQVVLNMVVNARDAMPEGGVLTLETRDVHLSEEFAQKHLGGKAGDYVLLAIHDTGSGMDEATRARVFEPFFTTKEPGKGTGLGLATVYGIVQQVGGSIAVHTQLGQGTSFLVYLPRLQSAVHSPQPQTVEGPAPGGSETILLVEDDERILELAAKSLELKGYTVMTAGNGPDAIRLCNEHPGPIDLVITDLVMPHMSGRELANRLYALRYPLKVLYISGYTDDAVARHGILQAEVDFLQKPFTPRALAHKVRSVLDQPGK